MNPNEIRQAYLDFMASKGHAIIPRANLVPKEDPTTLFTGSGMQPLVPYLLGEPHPAGDKLADSQTCFRAEDIDEIGDSRHTTFFEMLGNWSLGSYFKAEQLTWFWEFLTEVIELDPQRLYTTAFIGDEKFNVPRDEESIKIMTKLYEQAGINDPKVADMGTGDEASRRGMKPDERIFLYDGKKNWWNRGEKGPNTTPAGDPCGPNSEIFYEFTHIEHDSKWGEKCHPNCDCGRFVEIGNSVFMQFRKLEDGSLEPLAKPEVDFGGGLERIAQAVEGSGDMFKIDLLWPIIHKLEEISGFSYDQNPAAMRVIADHLRGAAFLAVDGVVPSNTAQGYVMRRIIRRAIRQALALDLKTDFFELVVPVITELYRDAYPEVRAHEESIIATLVREEKQFRTTLEKGLRVFGGYFDKKPVEFDPRTAKQEEVEAKRGHWKSAPAELTGELIFELFDTYGFPKELSEEEAIRRNIPIASDANEVFDHLMAEQKERSRTAFAGQFKGGLADHSDISIKYHTATHLGYKALRLVLGDHVIQRGSNITPERLRFDFSHPDKLTPEQIKQVEDIVNENIAKDWPMGYREIPTEQAFKEGALGAFGDKYGDTVKVYTAGDPDGEWFSKEICGGPHVTHTGALAEGGKKYKILKEESSSAGIRRIKAALQ
ncbi:MAG TPA: alanine--tRNA ligase [Candidatus Saccharimonadia bacterium]